MGRGKRTRIPGNRQKQDMQLIYFSSMENHRGAQFSTPHPANSGDVSKKRKHLFHNRYDVMKKASTFLKDLRGVQKLIICAIHKLKHLIFFRIIKISYSIDFKCLILVPLNLPILCSPFMWESSMQCASQCE